jgi:hypothetical protein
MRRSAFFPRVFLLLLPALLVGYACTSRVTDDDVSVVTAPKIQSGFAGFYGDGGQGGQGASPTPGGAAGLGVGGSTPAGAAGKGGAGQGGSAASSGSTSGSGGLASGAAGSSAGSNGQGAGGMASPIHCGDVSCPGAGSLAPCCLGPMVSKDFGPCGALFVDQGSCLPVGLTCPKQACPTYEPDNPAPKCCDNGDCPIWNFGRGGYFWDCPPTMPPGVGGAPPMWHPDPSEWGW